LEITLSLVVMAPVDPDCKAPAAVVRPDRYVYGVASTASDLARVIRNLEGALFGERCS
jgi:hypothetical protein